MLQTMATPAHSEQAFETALSSGECQEEEEEEEEEEERRRKLIFADSCLFWNRCHNSIQFIFCGFGTQSSVFFTVRKEEEEKEED